MGLDIRWPIGLMFSLIGLLLTGFGAMKPSQSMTKIGGQDINIGRHAGEFERGAKQLRRAHAGSHQPKLSVRDIQLRQQYRACRNDDKFLIAAGWSALRPDGDGEQRSR